MIRHGGAAGASYPPQLRTIHVPPTHVLVVACEASPPSRTSGWACIRAVRSPPWWVCEQHGAACAIPAHVYASCSTSMRSQSQSTRVQSRISEIAISAPLCGVPSNMSTPHTCTRTRLYITRRPKPRSPRLQSWLSEIAISVLLGGVSSSLSTTPHKPKPKIEIFALSHTFARAAPLPAQSLRRSLAAAPRVPPPPSLPSPVRCTPCPRRKCDSCRCHGCVAAYLPRVVCTHIRHALAPSRVHAAPWDGT